MFCFLQANALYIFLCTPNLKKIVLVLSTASTALVVVCECIRCHLDLLHLACSSEYAPEMSHNFYISRMACYCLIAIFKLHSNSLNYHHQNIALRFVTIYVDCIGIGFSGYRRLAFFQNIIFSYSICKLRQKKVKYQWQQGKKIIHKEWGNFRPKLNVITCRLKTVSNQATRQKSTHHVQCKHFAKFNIYNWN